LNEIDFLSLSVQNAANDSVLTPTVESIYHCLYIVLFLSRLKCIILVFVRVLTIGI